MSIKNIAKKTSDSHALMMVMKTVLVAFILALVIDFVYGFDISAVGSRNSTHRIVTMGEITLNNATVDSNGIINCGFDPQIFIGNIEGHIYSIELVCSKTNSSSLPVQCFVFDDDIGLVYESPFYSYTSKCNSLLIEVGCDGDTIRLDVGVDNSDSFKLEKIIVNPSLSNVIKSKVQNASVVRIVFLTAIIA